MLFVVHEDVTPFCSSSEGRHIEGLQNLLLMARRGEHALVISPPALKELAKNPSLGSRERSMARYLLSRRSELSQLEKLVQRKVIACLDDAPATPRRIGDDWYICVADLATRFNSKIILLAENIVDAALYETAAHHYRIHNKFKGVDISLIQRGGGGSQMDVELKASLEAGFATMAISDGDKNHPLQTPGDVALRCEDLSNSSLGVCWHYLLDCYSAENLVPLNVYVEACQHEDRHAERARIELMMLHALPQCSNPSKYYSWKKGINLSEIFSFDDDEKRKFWMNVAISVDRGQRCFGKCLNDKECNFAPCNCALAKGFGENCLKLVKNWCGNRSVHDSKNAFHSSLEWMQIGKIVFEAGLAFPPQRL